MTPFEYLDTWDALDLGQQHCLSSWDWKILWQPWPLGTDAQKGSSTNHSKAQGGRRSCGKVKVVEGWHHGIYLWSGWTLGGGVLGRISNDLNAIWRYFPEAGTRGSKNVQVALEYSFHFQCSMHVYCLWHRPLLHVSGESKWALALLESTELSYDPLRKLWRMDALLCRHLSQG